MPLDPERVYRKLESLQGDIAEILLHQKEQNGNVKHNMQHIAALTEQMERHSQILSEHCVRLGVLETTSELGAQRQLEFEQEAEGEFAWTREQIIDLLCKVLPWVGILGLLGERLLD